MQQQQAQLQQQIQLLASSPFGDSPLFRTAMSVSPVCQVFGFSWLCDYAVQLLENV